MYSNGSSPLARGTPPARHVRGDHRRFIPARAGNTVALGHRLVARRFIPARAGNTSRHRARTAASAVHPRSRGEHLRPLRRYSCATGSSPLARGTRLCFSLRRLLRRFIPARAGNTYTSLYIVSASAVHPRSRGEHDASLRARAGTGGSSPLARGTRTCSCRWRAPGRFIPARAGNTSAHRLRRCRSPVHPRSRGEHAHRAAPDVGRLRFIPARAGNTRFDRLMYRASSVHPRSRGEHSLLAAYVTASVGSSPLARGTQISRQTSQRR